jgi:hypothetical protein
MQISGASRAGSLRLPINQLKVDEAKAILRSFVMRSNASVWSNADDVDYDGDQRLRSVVKEESFGYGATRTLMQLIHIGMEVPQQLGAMFLMDGDEIDRLTHEIAPLWILMANDVLGMTSEPSLRFDVYATSWRSGFRRSPSSDFGRRRRMDPRSRALPFVRHGISVESLSVVTSGRTRYYPVIVATSAVLEVLGSDEFRVARE